MSDDKNKAQGDAGGDDVARHLAEKRKELNLQTRPLEVIADLDWDVDDDELPTEEPAAAAPAAPAAAAPVDTAAHDAQVAARGGTMLMSADAINQQLEQEAAARAAQQTPAAAPAAVAQAVAQTAQTAPQQNVQQQAPQQHVQQQAPQQHVPQQQWGAPTGPNQQWSQPSGAMAPSGDNAPASKKKRGILYGIITVLVIAIVAVVVVLLRN